jgi:hypothetical protein
LKKVGLEASRAPCHTLPVAKKAKPKLKQKPAKRKPAEDFNQAAFRVVQQATQGK